MRRALDRGAEHFNRGEFFEAHEVWEESWTSAPVRYRYFLQGAGEAPVALALKRFLPRYHLVQHRAESPDVGAGIGFFALELSGAMYCACR